MKHFLFLILLSTNAYAVTTVLRPNRFNVEDYGANGKDALDDTAAIQRAANAARDAGGGTIYLNSASTYTINDCGIKLYSNTKLFGDHSSVLIAISTFTPSTCYNGVTIDSNLIHNSTTSNYNTAATETNITIEGMTLDGRALSPRILFFQGVDGLTIKNTRMIRGYANGAQLDLRLSRNVLVDSNFIDGGGTSLGFNLLGQSTNVVITNNIFQNHADSNFSVGDGTFHCEKITVNGNIFRETTAYNVDMFGAVRDISFNGNYFGTSGLAAVISHSDSSTYPRDIKFDGNQFRSGTSYAFTMSLDSSTANSLSICGNDISGYTQAVNINHGWNVNITKNHISNNSSTGIGATNVRSFLANGNILWSNAGYGIRVDDLRGAVITSNYVSSGSYSGIACVGCSDSNISDNVVKNFGQLNDGTFKHGIQIANGTLIAISSNNIVSGNRVYDDQATKKQDTGLMVTGASAFNSFLGNNLKGNLTNEETIPVTATNTTNNLGNFYVKKSSGLIVMQSPDGTCGGCFLSNSDIFTCVSMTCP